MSGMTCSYAEKYFLLDFAKTSGGYEPIGFPLQLSEASHIIKMALAGESRPSSSSPLADEIVFFEDSVLMQTIANIISYATRSYAYVKSYNDTKHKGYHAIVVATDGPHICANNIVPQLLTSANPIQTLCAHNPKGPVLIYSEDPSNEYLKDLTTACERYNVHILLLSTNIFDNQAFDTSFFDQPASMLTLPCKESTNSQSAKRPIPSVGPSMPQNNQDLIKPENNEMTVTLRDVLLHTPVQSPKDNGSPHSRDKYATDTDGDTVE
ncbi:hypothetical protein AFLA70_100g002181 [Aspergillus flavus AF70]|nr:hypothetical protein AFLA70_100g002181 [Aspergillus flavus AF70]